MLSPVFDAAPVVLVLPAHDEATTVADVVERAPVTVTGHPVVVVVVDDGSTDATATAAAAAGAQVESFGANRGLGAAVAHGLAVGVAMGAVAVAFCDADGEYAPEELEAMVAPILADEADYVIGTRLAGGRPATMRPHRWVGNRVLTAAMRTITGLDITDGQSGFRALSAAAAGRAVICHDYNYAQVLTLDLLAQGFRYREVPISYRFRTEGRSFIEAGPYLRKVVPAVATQLRARPLPRRTQGVQSSTTKRRKDVRAESHAR